MSLKSRSWSISIRRSSSICQTIRVSSVRYHKWVYCLLSDHCFRQPTAGCKSCCWRDLPPQPSYCSNLESHPYSLYLKGAVGRKVSASKILTSVENILLQVRVCRGGKRLTKFLLRFENTLRSDSGHSPLQPTALSSFRPQTCLGPLGRQAGSSPSGMHREHRRVVERPCSELTRSMTCPTSVGAPCLLTKCWLQAQV